MHSEQSELSRAIAAVNLIVVNPNTAVMKLNTVAALSVSKIHCPNKGDSFPTTNTILKITWL